MKKTIRQTKYNYYNYRFTEFKNDMKRSWDTLKPYLIGKIKIASQQPSFTKTNGLQIPPSLQINLMNIFVITDTIVTRGHDSLL